MKLWNFIAGASDRMAEAKYIAVIGDVVGSRRAPDRAGLQDRLGAGLRDVNAGFESQVAAAFVLTVGDEFQGLLGSTMQLDKVLATLRAHAFPAELRLGLGMGELDTALRAQALGMDGPCFHRAREAVERAAARKTPIEVEAGDPSSAMEIYAVLSGHQRSRWTRRQREVVDLSMSGMEGQEIAAYLSVSPSAVSQHLTAAGAAAFRRATAVWLRETTRLLEDCWRTHEYLSDRIARSAADRIWIAFPNRSDRAVDRPLAAVSHSGAIADLDSGVAGHESQPGDSCVARRWLCYRRGFGRMAAA
jgi:hypothetical protein